MHRPSVSPTNPFGYVQPPSPTEWVAFEGHPVAANALVSPLGQAYQHIPPGFVVPPPASPPPFPVAPTQLRTSPSPPIATTTTTTTSTTVTSTTSPTTQATASTPRSTTPNFAVHQQSKVPKFYTRLLHITEIVELLIHFSRRQTGDSQNLVPVSDLLHVICEWRPAADQLETNAFKAAVRAVCAVSNPQSQSVDATTFLLMLAQTRLPLSTTSPTPTQTPEIDINTIDVIDEVICETITGISRRAIWHNAEVMITKTRQAEMSRSQAFVTSFFDKASWLCMQRHPNLMVCLGAGATESGLFMVTEFVRGKSVDEFLSARDSPALRDSQFLKIGKQIAEALRYLHQHDPPVELLELTSEHVVVDSDFVVKVCFTGFTKHDLTSRMSFKANFMAPEQLVSSTRFCGKCDVFAFGVILYQLLTKVLPYPRFSPYEIAHQVGVNKKSPKFPERTPPSVKSLIERCMAPEPLNRPTFKQICEELAEISTILSETNRQSEHS